MRNTVPTINVSAEILALCGDIGYPKTEIYQNFIKWASENYELVLLIAGNHEYYHKKIPMQEMNEFIRSVAQKYSNVIFLEQEWRLLRCAELTIRVFGAVFWTDLRNHPGMRYLMSDYKQITTLTNPPGSQRVRAPIRTPSISDIHLKTIEQLEEILKDNIPTIVLSHHLPSKGCVPVQDEYTPGYATNLEHLLKPPIILWLCGHSHTSIDKKIGSVRVVSNQMGYPFENGLTGYKTEMQIDVKEIISKEQK